METTIMEDIAPMGSLERLRIVVFHFSMVPRFQVSKSTCSTSF